MKIVTYSLEDMQEISELLNIVSQRGINLEQAKAVAIIAGIIDNKNFGIEDSDDLDKCKEELEDK